VTGFERFALSAAAAFLAAGAACGGPDEAGVFDQGPGPAAPVCVKDSGGICPM
jgi:hypothetical protein